MPQYTRSMGAGSGVFLDVASVYDIEKREQTSCPFGTVRIKLGRNVSQNHATQKQPNMWGKQWKVGALADAKFVWHVGSPMGKPIMPHKSNPTCGVSSGRLDTHQHRHQHPRRAV